MRDQMKSVDPRLWEIKIAYHKVVHTHRIASLRGAFEAYSSRAVPIQLLSFDKEIEH